MASVLRRTGLPVGDMPWGSHLHVFYETKRDLLDTLALYFRAGLESNELCILANSDLLTIKEAEAALGDRIPGFARHLEAGHMQILPTHEWFRDGDTDLKRLTGGWRSRTRLALAEDYEGVRISGNAFWIESAPREEFQFYEDEIDRTFAGQPMLGLCTYPLAGSRAIDILDVARAHRFTLARRRGEWEIVETPELKQERAAARSSEAATKIVASLTERERQVLALMVKGSTNKEVGRELGISGRTVEVYRHRILRKTAARNLPELIHLVVLSEMAKQPNGA